MLTDSLCQINTDTGIKRLIRALQDIKIVHEFSHLRHPYILKYLRMLLGEAFDILQKFREFGHVEMPAVFKNSCLGLW